MRSRARSSDRRGSLIVIEGMPGAGKTSAAAALSRRGHQVVHEYVCERPDVDDDDGHQRNWIAKAAMAASAAASGDVFCDRDFVTSIAFAFSIEDDDLLRQRTAWTLAHLAAGSLIVGDAYLMLDVPPRLSLERRAAWLSPDHPWSGTMALEQLRRFYLSPVGTLGRLDRDLEAAFAGARWCSASGDVTTPDQVADLAERLAREVARCRP